jgi:hypothetical protein
VFNRFIATVTRKLSVSCAFCAFLGEDAGFSIPAAAIVLVAFWLDGRARAPHYIRRLIEFFEVKPELDNLGPGSESALLVIAWDSRWIASIIRKKVPLKLTRAVFQ